MKKYLVIGNPIEHSLSPKLHNYWFIENNIDAIGIDGSKQKINFAYGESTIPITYRSRRDGQFDLNEDSIVKIFDWNEESVNLEIDGHRISSNVTKLEDQVIVKMPWGNVSLETIPRFVLPGSEEVAGGLIAPMPGKVVDLKVKVGDNIEVGRFRNVSAKIKILMRKCYLSPRKYSIKLCNYAPYTP